MPNYEDPLEDYFDNKDPDKVARKFYIITRIMMISTFTIGIGVILYILFTVGIL